MKEEVGLSVPKVLAVIPGFIPSTTIDVVQPMLDLQQAGLIHFKVALEFFLNPKDKVINTLMRLKKEGKESIRYFLGSMPYNLWIAFKVNIMKTL